MGRAPPQTEYDRLKAQFDALWRARQLRAMPPLRTLPTMEVSRFRATMIEAVPPLVITHYGKPRWVLLEADQYEEDCALQQDPAHDR